MATFLTERYLQKCHESFFMQYGTNSHTAKVNDKWLKENIQNCWEKVIWPGNSPDLNPIENLRAILHQGVGEVDLPSTTESRLEDILKEA